MRQLTDVGPCVQSRVITGNKDFDQIFSGFTSMKAISYVASPDLVLELLEKWGYEQILVLVGENDSGLGLARNFRQGLSDHRDVAERLLRWVERGTLQILIPPRTIHTKLYILRDSQRVRVVMTSANLTQVARSARRQVNYAWYLDVSPDDRWLVHVSSDFDSQCKGSELFMGDLLSLLRSVEGADRNETVEAWLTGGAIGEGHVETRRVLRDVAAAVLDPELWNQEPVFRIRLPKADAARREIERFLAPAKPTITSSEVSLQKIAYLRYVQEDHGIPLMRIDRSNGAVLLGMDGTLRNLTEPLAEPTLVDRALDHIEEYLQTVDLGETREPRFAKMSMYEALLYFLYVPFANEYMEVRRRRFAGVDSRGPRFLYIYGPSHNGKTTFLRFALKLICGQRVEPLMPSSFSKTTALTAMAFGSVFPLVFDDLTPSRRSGPFEEIVKSFWEAWWQPGHPSPQLIVSSNTESLKDWAKSRVKRVDFDVYFAPNETNKERLSALLAVENPLFAWFSHEYLTALGQREVANDDELQLAREIMVALYSHANRKVPDYFPLEPVEQVYDPGRIRWADLLRLKQARIRRENRRLLVYFSTNMQYPEIKDYETDIPQTIRYRREGKMLVIESPQGFDSWLNGQRPKGLLNRLIGRSRP